MTHRGTFALLLAANLGCITDSWSPPRASDAGALIDRSTPTDGSEAAVADLPSDDAPTARCEGPTWRTVRCGNGFCCAVRCDANVWCWGRNDTGQLGVGDATARAAPTRVAGPSARAASLALGYNHACALHENGEVWCWGLNTGGVLGPLSTVSLVRPTRVEGFTERVVAITAGGEHMCALYESGALACWGANGRGQLGDGRTRAQFAPQTVSLLTAPVAEVTCGQYHTCARRRDGTLACWGQNTFGTLANGSFNDVPRPVEVTLPAAVLGVQTYANHVYTLLDDGTLWSWGYNTDGQLGNGSRATSAVPVQVSPALPEVVSLAAGQDHGCARSMDGSVRCWGGNASGQLGDGTTTRRVRPGAPVVLGEPATDIASGDLSNCAILQSGAMVCWGSNREGQLGDGTLQDRLTPVRVVDPG